MEIAGNPTSGQAKGGSVRLLVPMVVALFFAWGFATVLIDALVPKLRGLFQLTYLEAALTQSCFFAAYFIVSLPAAALLSRIGYLKSVVVGLVVMAIGCLLFAPAAQIGIYATFLVALFIMASGITLLQVAANPLIALLGRPETSHSRLTFAQFFNSFATFIGPFVGAAFILREAVETPDVSTLSAEQLAAFRLEGAQHVQGPFLAIAAGLILMAVLFWVLRKKATLPEAQRAPGLGETLALLKRPRLAFAVLSIFVYVGAEVAIGSFLTNYLAQPRVLGLSLDEAHKLLAYYWGGAMVGRFIGGFVLGRVSPGKVLAFCAVMAGGLAVVSALTSGPVAAWTLIAVGLFNSIMFPTIFTLGIEGMEEKTPQASGLICMAIVGGAIIPPITGWVADHAGLALSLIVPAVCYLWIAFYGWFARRAVKDAEAPVAPPTGA
jgi:FHS family L-fucose permease-like MFS transporter